MRTVILFAFVLFGLSIVGCDDKELSEEIYEFEQAATDKGELEEEDVTPPN